MNLKYDKILGKIREGDTQNLPYTLIESMNDFPAPVLGVITLPTGVYRLANQLVTSNRIEIEDGAVVNIYSDEAFLFGITYTGTGTLFTGTDFFGLTSQNVYYQTPAGSLLDIQATTPGIGSEVFFIICALDDCLNLGTVKNSRQFFMTDNAITNCGNGFILDSIVITLFSLINFTRGKDTGGTFLTIQGTCETVSINGLTSKPEASESTLYIDPALTLSGGNVYGCALRKELGGEFFAPGSDNQTNKYWKFTGNVNIPDSGSKCEIENKNNSLLTDINVINTPILVNGNWTDSIERFETTSSGRGTYIGLEDISLGIFSNPEIVLETGTNKNITIYFSKGNDTLNTIASFADAGGGQVIVTTDNDHGLLNGDRVPITNTINYNGTYTISNVTANTFEITKTFVATETGNWQIIIERSSAHNQIPSSSKSAQIPILTRVEFKTNDFVEMFAENNSDGSGIIVQNANILIG